MDAGLAQVVSSVLGGLASIIVAGIAGYFTVRAAEVRVRSDTLSTNQLSGQRISSARGKFIFYAFITGLIGLPLGFVIAYTGNTLGGLPPEQIGFSFDPALVSFILGFVGFLLGTWAGKRNLGSGRLFLLFLIVIVFSAPVAYSLGYTGNYLSGVVVSQLFVDSIDSLFVGALICSLSFVHGAMISKRFAIN
jgi:hypothetical protein